MSRPSGDQAGIDSFVVALVSRVTSPEATVAIQMS